MTTARWKWQSYPDPAMVDATATVPPSSNPFGMLYPHIPTTVRSFGTITTVLPYDDAHLVLVAVE